MTVLSAPRVAWPTLVVLAGALACWTAGIALVDASPLLAIALATLGAYAAFTPLEYVQEYLPSTIRKQVGTFKEIADPLQQCGQQKETQVVVAVDRAVMPGADDRRQRRTGAKRLAGGASEQDVGDGNVRRNCRCCCKFAESRLLATAALLALLAASQLLVRVRVHVAIDRFVRFDAGGVGAAQRRLLASSSGLHKARAGQQRASDRRESSGATARQR